MFALIVGVYFTDGDIVFNEIRVMVGRGSGKNGFISFLCFYFLSPYHGIRGYNIDLMANADNCGENVIQGCLRGDHRSGGSKV